MQAELAADGYAVQLFAINEIGFGGVATMAERGDLPLLQDTAEQNAWSRWDVTYRDVVIVDRNNRQVGVFNLTTNTLSDPTNYTALKTLLIETAE